MNYLEVKYEEQTKKELDPSSFISDVIDSQKSLGLEKKVNSFDHEKLQKLGFIQNGTTKGYGLQKEFTLHELIHFAKEVNKLENHNLTHGYIVLKYFENELYFWDTALIYEGVDTFSYCLEYHNTFRLGSVNVVTKSTSVNEELLNLAGCTKRYHEPTLGFITQGCMWDKKQGIKIQKGLITNINEYIKLDEVITY